MNVWNDKNIIFFGSQNGEIYLVKKESMFIDEIEEIKSIDRKNMC